MDATYANDAPSVTTKAVTLPDYIWETVRTYATRMGLTEDQALAHLARDGWASAYEKGANWIGGNTNLHESNVQYAARSNAAQVLNQPHDTKSIRMEGWHGPRD